MKIQLAGALTFLMLLGACGATEQAPPEPLPSASVTQAPEAGQPLEIVFAISQEADDILTGAANSFVYELQARTNGQLSARIQPTAAPQDELLAGRAQFALLCQRSQLEFCSALAVTATPFLYHSPDNFLMRVNSGNTMSILDFSLRQHHGLVPLAAFYQGAEHLLIDFSPGGYHHFYGMSIVTSEDGQLLESFARLAGVNGTVFYFGTDQQRIDAFLLGRANAAQVSLKSALHEHENLPYSAHLIASYHDIVPVWLLAQAELIDELSPALRAEVTELKSRMSSRVNSAYLAIEDRLLSQASDSTSLQVLFEFAGVRNRVFHTLPELQADASVYQRLVRDLLEIMRRTA